MRINSPHTLLFNVDFQVVLSSPILFLNAGKGSYYYIKVSYLHFLVVLNIGFEVFYCCVWCRTDINTCLFSSEVIEKLHLRNFHGSQVPSFDFPTLCTSLPHDLIKAKVLSLVNWCFNRESKTYICTSHKAGLF